MSQHFSKAYVDRLDATGIHRCEVTNIYAIGRNYTEHAKELGNEVPSEPVVFLKPTASLVHEPDPIVLPRDTGDIHFETELVVLMGDNISECLTKDNALTAVSAYGLGLDLTDRDKQSYLKQHGLPWTLAKGFRGSAPISQFIPAEKIDNLLKLSYTLTVNQTLRQQADLALMLFSIPDIIIYLHKHIGLQAGDLIFTGTPAGVGPLHVGDTLRMGFDHYPLQATFQVKDVHDK